MRSPRKLSRYGGMLCLDFINTVDWRGRQKPDEYLNSYGDLLEWSVLAGALTQHEAEQLKRHVRKTVGTAALARVIAFREAAHRLLLAHFKAEAPNAHDLQQVNAIVAKARSHVSLQPSNGSFLWAFAKEQRNPDLPLWRISLSLAHLLTSEELKYVRECGGKDCGWFFLDSTKNHKRRWCSMDGCGNRAKAQRFYARSL